MKKYLPIFITLVSPVALSATTASDPSIMVMTCPTPSAIKKDPVKLTWSADRNNFRSYDISFANEVSKFTGAQWNGATVGQITCVYQTTPKPSFPLLLIYHTLTLDPTGGSWSKNLGGYKNCDSFDVKQCSFKIRLKAKQENVYQEAESLKSNTPPTIPSE